MSMGAEEMIARVETTERLDKEKILRTATLKVVFEGMLQGMKYAEIAEKARLKPATVKHYAYKYHLNRLVEQEKADILAKTVARLEITSETQVQKLEEHRDKALELGQITAANGAVRQQSELAGLLGKEERDLGKACLAAVFAAAVRQLGPPQLEAKPVKSVVLTGPR